MNGKKLITIESGKKVEYNIIIEFTSNKNNKHFVAYTDNSKDELGNIKVLIASYEIDRKDSNIYILTPLKEKSEIDMVNNILKDLSK